MSLRPGAWLAPVAIVALLALGAATAIHSQSLRIPAAHAAQHDRLRGAAGIAYGSGDLVPANASHQPLGYVPPSPSPLPSTRPPVVTPPRVAPAPAIAIGSYQQQLINRDRAAHGLRPLPWS